jgi:hypothetical protein
VSTRASTGIRAASIWTIEPSIAKAMRLPSGDHDGHHGVLLAAGAK